MLQESILVKIGGKILESQRNLKFTISQLNQLIQNKKVQRIIIIPGGGTFANYIRILDKKFNLGDHLAHFMAIFAMDYNGIEINKLFPEIPFSDNFKELKKSQNSILIFLPYNYLHENDVLPHSWNVTSDSISLYIAYKLGIKQTFLIKDIDGIYLKDEKLTIKEISTKEYKIIKNNNKLAIFNIAPLNMKETSPLDSYILNLIDEYQSYCIIINGTPPNYRIIDFFDQSKTDEEKEFTKIFHNPIP